MKGHFPDSGQFESRLMPHPGGHAQLEKCPCSAVGSAGAAITGDGRTAPGQIKPKYIL